jgi:tetraacyldisaccharide 4'-kinase
LRPSDIVLVPLSGVYGLLQILDRSIKMLGRASASRPVVSVGNLTTGGSGKTPFTVLLCGLLAGLRPVILSRGYGAKNPRRVIRPADGPLAGRAGDEPEMLRDLTGRPVSVDADRTAASRRAASLAGVFVMDDGFQHYRLRRDADILLLDVSVPRSEYRLLPAGRLREPISAVRRADIVVLTRCDAADPETLRFLTGSLQRLGIRKERIFRSRLATDRVRDQKGRTVQASRSKGGITAFAGIAKFASFRDSVLATFGTRKDIVFLPYPDHHRYGTVDIALLKSHADRGRTLLTTEKDAVKLRGRIGPFLTIRVRCVLEDQPRFKRTLLSLIGDQS